MAKLTKKDFLKDTIKHIDLKKYNVVPLVEAFGNMAYASREVARASRHFVHCGVACFRGYEESCGGYDSKQYG